MPWNGTAGCRSSPARAVRFWFWIAIRSVPPLAALWKVLHGLGKVFCGSWQVLRRFLKTLPRFGKMLPFLGRMLPSVGKTPGSIGQIQPSFGMMLARSCSRFQENRLEIWIGSDGRHQTGVLHRFCRLPALQIQPCFLSAIAGSAFEAGSFVSDNAPWNSKDACRNSTVGPRMSANPAGAGEVPRCISDVPPFILQSPARIF